jgi:hypothetical protein
MSEQNEFHNLKQLLKLKQHEVPPPGYFNHFSSDVISRIRAGDARKAQGFMERIQDETPWLASFLGIFESKPGIIGGFATSLCLILLIGVVIADRPEPSSVQPAAMAMSVAGPGSAPGVGDLAAAVAPPEGNTGIAVGTNSSIASFQPAASLFGQQQNLLFQPVGFARTGQ